MPTLLQQQQDLEKLLAIISSPAEKEELRSLCMKRPELIPKLLENYHRKVQAIQNEDADAVKKIFEDERKLIDSMPS